MFATNSPINDRVALHSKMAPYRTYAMAFTLPRGALPDALYWDMADPYHYIRLQPGPGSTDYLIVGGKDHKSGEADDGDIRFEALEAWIRERVPKLGKEVARWSGQVMDTIDYCGFIGFNPGNKRVLVATGNSGQGMTHGALAGILAQESRHLRRRRMVGCLRPVAHARVGDDEFHQRERHRDQELRRISDARRARFRRRTEARRGRHHADGMKKIAVSRDHDGTLHVCSAVCTHLGCHVHWNTTEQCWDCPCHGSQFDRTARCWPDRPLRRSRSEMLSGDPAMHEKANV